MGRGSVVIVGGGISGLSAAWELSGGAQGPTADTPRIELIEAGDHFGGALTTTDFAGRRIDLGADGFLARRPEAVALVADLGWQDQLEAIDASGASLWLRGALHRLPEGLVLGLPVTHQQIDQVKGLSWRARLAARRDERMPAKLAVKDDMSIGEIVRTKLGRELSYQFIEPMIGGIQAGRIDELSAKSVFPPLLDAARRGGSLMKALRPAVPVTPAGGALDPGPMFYSLLGGVGSLAKELERRLSERGVVLRCGVAVTALRRTPSGDYPWEVDTTTTTTPADVVIFAAPAPVAGQLLGTYDPALRALASVKRAGAAMVTFAIARSDVTLTESGTGILVPLATPWSGEGTLMITAVTLLDRKWPRLRREDDVILRAHVGRIDDDRWAAMDDEELVARVARELGEVLPHFGVHQGALVQRWPQGLPQYLVGHDQMIAAAKAASAPMRVALCGMAYDGVGIPASIGSGRRAAREALAMLLA
jgi:oxygen-dependent protoporphyrinogen oxidase